jgi:Zn-dependent peptidase ImmA (M78 family)
MMDWKERRQLAGRAAMEAERMRLFANISRTDPIDPFETAIKCGCEVRFMSLSSLEGIYSPDPGPAIILGSERPAGRRTYTCAHELGHHVFNHGMRVEDINEKKKTKNKSPEEFLADLFAAFMLMSQASVLCTLKDRGWLSSNFRAEQIYRLANFFGVGYGTIIKHLELSLQLINSNCAEELLKTQPKQIKVHFGGSANSEVVLVDYHWRHKAVDLEVGDTLILPLLSKIDLGIQLEYIAANKNYLIFKAIKPGYSRAYCDDNQWAVNIRISRKNYEGLVQYRFLEESEIVT